MACACAHYDADSGRYICSITGDGCLFMFPDAKKCAAEYGEGPESGDCQDDLEDGFEDEEGTEIEETIPAKFYVNGELQDEIIVEALNQAVKDYETGCIAEVRDALEEIIAAIYEFEDGYEG